MIVCSVFLVVYIGIAMMLVFLLQLSFVLTFEVALENGIESIPFETELKFPANGLYLIPYDEFTLGLKTHNFLSNALHITPFLLINSIQGFELLFLS